MTELDFTGKKDDLVLNFMRRHQCQIPMGEHSRPPRAVRRLGGAEKDVGQTAPSLEQSHSPVLGEPEA